MGKAPERARIRPLKPGDDEGDRAVRGFARAALYERAWLHGILEVPALRARANVHAAWSDGRVVGLAALVEGLAAYRFAALAGALPGVVEALVAVLPRPFVCPAPLRSARELERAGGRRIGVERLLVRFEIDACARAESDAAEPLRDPAEIAHFCGRSFTSLQLDCGPFFGVRDSHGELVAVAGVHFASERLALLSHLETREDSRRIGHARRVLAALARALETPERRLAIAVGDERPALAVLLARLGFRAVSEGVVFAF